MKMPWTRKTDKQEDKLKMLEKDQAELELLREARKNAQREMDRLLSGILEIRKGAGNGDH